MVTPSPLLGECGAHCPDEPVVEGEAASAGVGHGVGVEDGGEADGGAHPGAFVWASHGGSLASGAKTLPFWALNGVFRPIFLARHDKPPAGRRSTAGGMVSFAGDKMEGIR